MTKSRLTKAQRKQAFRDELERRESNRPRAPKVPVVRLTLFLFAVITLIYYRGFDPSIFMMFVLPLLGAYAVTESETARYRFIATMFLVLVSLGVAVAKTEWLFPDLQMDDDLPPIPNRILAWYGGVYLLYIFSVVPLVVFIGFLIEHGKGDDPGWSRFTCILGLVAGLILTPAAIKILADIGFWPIFSLEQ